MLNYPSAERFFENCLLEAGLVESWSKPVMLSEIQANPALRREVLKSLRDVMIGADAVLAKGKPAEDTLNLPAKEWERHWSAWASSRRAAFFARSALLMLRQPEYFDYFLDILRTSHNIVFLSGASDVLQHASGHYLSGPEEDLSNGALASWWEKQQVKAKGRLFDETGSL